MFLMTELSRPQLVVMTTRDTVAKTKKSVERIDRTQGPSAMGAVKWLSWPHYSSYLIRGFVLTHFITTLYLIYKATPVDLRSPPA